MIKKYVDIYNMTNDTNFGPHHDGGIITLACCMVDIRKKVGDLWNDLSHPKEDLEYWIVGRVASYLSSKKKNHLVYFMKVDDVINFAEYSRKYSLRTEKNGRKDNIYKFNGNCGDELNPDDYDELYHVKNHSPKHDIGKGKYVLLSEDYCYFDWRNNPYDEKLGEWGFDELKWIPPGNKGPFRRKFRFNDTDEIIDKLKEIKKENCQRYVPDGEGCGGCGRKKDNKEDNC